MNVAENVSDVFISECSLSLKGLCDVYMQSPTIYYITLLNQDLYKVTGAKMVETGYQ